MIMEGISLVGVVFNLWVSDSVIKYKGLGLRKSHGIASCARRLHGFVRSGFSF